jgi:hypothetical protein
MKNLKYLVLAILLCQWTVSFSQDEEKPAAVTFSGSVDTYFRTNLNAQNKGEGFQAPATSFGNLPGFSLGMANIIATYEGEKVGFVADLVFGPRGEDAVFGSPLYNGGLAGSSQIVNQLYVYWALNDKVTITAGNFNTFIGYEVISPTGNFNYSTSYMFSYGPFSHTGVKADFTLSENWGFMASVMNPTDMTEFNLLGTYTYGAQLSHTKESGGTYLNFLYGDQDGKLEMNNGPTFGNTSLGTTFQVDLTTGYNVTDAVFLGFNGTYNTSRVGQIRNGSSIIDATGDGAGFYGVAGYFQAKTSEKFSLGARMEYFNVYNEGLEGVVPLDNGTGDGSVIAITLSGNAKVAKTLTIIPEVRLDSMSDNFFLNKDLGDSKSLTSFLIAAVFSF